MFLLENRNLLLIGSVAAFFAGAYVIWGPNKKLKTKRKGTCPGLVNLGNTCFLNAVLQAFAPCSSVAQWLAEFVSKQKDMYGQYLASTMLNVVKVLNNDSIEHQDEYEPGDVVSALQARRWVISSEEQDAHELFHVLTETLDEETQAFTSMPSLFDVSQIQESAGNEYQPPSKARNRINTQLPVLPSKDRSHPFKGLLASQLQCKKCAYKYPVKYDTFDSLSLSFPEKYIPGILSLEQLLHHFIMSEAIKDVQCEGCTKKRSRGSADTRSKLTATFVKKMTIGKLPQCMCIHLQRTVWLENGLSMKKTEHVRFPEMLNMSEFVYSKKPHSVLRPNSLDLGENGARLRGGKNNVMSSQHSRTCPTPSPVLSPPYSGPVNLLKALNWHAKSSLNVASSQRPQNDTAQIQRLVEAYSVEAPPTMVLPGNMYRLVAVIVHLGDTNSGHFITYRRAPSKIGQRFPDGWLYTSDTMVRRASLAEVMDSNAYMLFYEKF